jgi:hypothetical protein
MFKNLRNTLDQLSKTTSVSVGVSADEKGYFDKECPSETCLFRFKVKAEDWTRLEAGSQIACPMCRHCAATNKWYTTEQVEKAKAKAIATLQGAINRAMRDDARKFNQRPPRNSFIKMSMKVTGGERTSDIEVPIEAAEAMELEITCESCSTRFAVVGSAFFCPGCGHNSAERMFDDALRKIDVKVSNVDVVRDAIERQTGKDAAAVTARSMLESCLPDGVVAFQKHCEALYAKLPGAKPAPINAFQRLHDGSELWHAAVGHGYLDWINTGELRTLSIMFQRRHLLAHAEGIVDAKYLGNTSDAEYVAGQWIVVRPNDVRQMIGILSKLAKEIRAAVATATGVP